MEEERLTLYVCECCLLKIANDDVSGCKDFHEHTHDPASALPDGHAVSTWSGEEPPEIGYFECDGCEDMVMDHRNPIEMIR